MFSRVRGSVGSDCRNRYVGLPQPPRFGHEPPAPSFSFSGRPGDGSMSSPGLQIFDTDSQISRMCSGSATVRCPPLLTHATVERSLLAMYMYWSSRTFRLGWLAATVAILSS